MTTFEIKTPYSTHQVVQKKLTSGALCNRPGSLRYVEG